MTKNNKTKGIFLAILSAMMFGTSPMFVNFFRSEGINTLTTVFTGCLLSLIIYLLILTLNKNLKSLKIEKNLIGKLVISSLVFYSTLGLLFFSYTKIPSGIATVIHFIYPILVTIISIKAGRDKLTFNLVIVIICTFFGVALVSDFSHQSLNLIGVLLATLSAITYTIYIYLINDEGLKKLDNTVFVFYVSFIGAFFLLFAIFIQNSFFSSVQGIWGNSFSTKVLIGALGLGLTQGFGVIFFALGVKYVGGPIGGTLSAFEPLTAVFIGTCFFQESLTLICIIGCVLILGSTTFLSISEIKGKTKG
ncbi:MAG: EamA family transporter [Sphaerochaetaceae bacterium]|nr:EamA family transporter [Sphaerochaetaceae bacterium]